MKMSVVGCEASGKTVFMSALADYYNGGERPCLVPENESANNFQRFQLRQMRSLHQWPPATDPGKTIELKWTLRKDGNVLANVDMLEFGGETFREAFRGEKASTSHQEAVDALKQHLASSEFVVVLVSLRDLLRDQGTMSNEEFERDTEALWVTRGLLTFLSANAPKARVVIGLTQADLHRGEIDAAGGADKLFQQRWPSVAAVASEYPIIPIASVSATDADGNPAPDYTTDGILPVMEEFKKAKPNARLVAQGGKPSRMPLLILLLIACGCLAWSLFNKSPSTPIVERIVQTNIVENTVTTTNVIENLVTTTNVVENLVTTTNTVESIVVTTNTVENVVTSTNVVENVVTLTNVVETAAEPVAAPTNAVGNASAMPNLIGSLIAEKEPKIPPLRTWHDHNGTAVDARWVSTTEDRKRIIIETVNGTRIRAAIRKFSAEDQRYITEQLNSQTNSVNPAGEAH